MNAAEIYVNLFWNETGDQTGLSKLLNDGKNVLVSLYNPGSKGTYPIRLRVPPRNLTVLSSSNSLIAGDVVCSNLKD